MHLAMQIQLWKLPVSAVSLEINYLYVGKETIAHSTADNIHG